MHKVAISFDVEDLPPPTYYQRSAAETQASARNASGNEEQCCLSGDRGTIKTIDDIGASVNKEDWWKAPEFVPRSYANRPRQCDSLFNHELTTSVALCDASPQQPAIHPLSSDLMIRSQHAAAAVRPLVPIWPRLGSSHYPPPPPVRFYPVHLGSTAPIKPSFGYSANIATLSAAMVPPIAAVILKKKRKKKNRRAKVGAEEEEEEDDEEVLLENCSVLNGGRRADEEQRSIGDQFPIGQQLETVNHSGQSVTPGGNSSTLINADAHSCPDLSQAQRNQLDEFVRSKREQFLVESNPVVDKVVQELLLGTGDPERPGICGIRSERVRELDRQVMSELHEQWKTEGRRSQRPMPALERVEEVDLYDRLVSNFDNSSNDDEQRFLGQPIRSIRQEIEETTFLQHRPKTVELGGDLSNQTRSTVVKYKAGSLVTEINADNPNGTMESKHLNLPFIPRATFVEDDIADGNDDYEDDFYANTCEVDEIEFPDIRQAAYPYPILDSNGSIRRTVVVQRRHSMSDANASYFQLKSPACCAIM